MASIPLPALGIQQQPGPIDQYAKAVQLKSLLGGQQIQQQEIQKNQMEIQKAQQDQADQQKLRQIYMKNNGDIGKTIEDAGKSGVTPATVEKLRQAHIQQMNQYLTMTKDQLANGQAIAKAVGDSASAVLNAPDAMKDQVYQQEAARLLQMGVPKDQVPPQRPPDDVLKLHAMAAMSTKDQMDLAQKKIDDAERIKHESETSKPSDVRDYEYAQKQGFKGTFEEWKKNVVRAPKADNSEYQNTHRADQSYQFNSAALDKLKTPIDAIVSRLGRLNDTLAQNTPQADALVAPELMVVMAGGQGSGMRINEAEINRVVGGRSKWEALKAAVNQWQLDSKKALSITPEQRREIHDLTDLVNQKASEKQQILDDARQALINTDDPKEHRKIVADANSKLSGIDRSGTTSKKDQFSQFGGKAR